MPFSRPYVRASFLALAHFLIGHSSGGLQGGSFSSPSSEGEGMSTETLGLLVALATLIVQTIDLIED